MGLIEHDEREVERRLRRYKRPPSLGALRRRFKRYCGGEDNVDSLLTRMVHGGSLRSACGVFYLRQPDFPWDQPDDAPAARDTSASDAVESPDLSVPSSELRSEATTAPVTATTTVTARVARCVNTVPRPVSGGTSCSSGDL